MTEYNWKSNIAFAIGATLVRVHTFLQIPYISFVFQPMALGFYTVAYFVWAAEVQDDAFLHKNSDESTTLRQKFMATITLGLIATGLGIAGLFFPILLIPAGVVLTLSNLFWCWSEFHRANKLSAEQPNTKQQNDAYFQYVCVVTLASALMTVLGLTALFVPVFLFYALGITPVLAGIIIAAWAHVTFFTHPTATKPTSPILSSAPLSQTPSLAQRNHQQSPLHSHSPSSSISELNSKTQLAT